MAGRVGRLRGGESCRSPALAQRRKERDRDGDQCGLGVDSEIELLGRAVESQAADRLAQRVVGFGEDGRRCR